MATVLLKLRRAETPVYRRLKQAVLWLRTVRIPLPVGARPILRGLYAFHCAVPALLQRLYMVFYGEPLFRSRCEQFGSNCFIGEIPWVNGQTKIYVHDNVSIYGKLSISSGRTVDEPRLVLGDGIEIGHNVQIVVGQQVILESGVLVANDCLITDTETHARDPKERYLRQGPKPGRDIQPVLIRKDAWIGANCAILKGVTIGEGAIIGSRSVVISDIPDWAIAMGNPARVIGAVRAKSAAASVGGLDGRAC